MRHIYLLFCIFLISVTSNAQWGEWNKITTFHYVPDKIINFDGKMAVAARYNEVAIMEYSYDVLLSDDHGTSWKVACSFHSTPETTVVVTNLATSDSLLYMLVEYTTSYSKIYRMFSLDHYGTVTNYGICNGLNSMTSPSVLLKQDSVFYLACEINGYYTGMFISTDYGVNWTISNNGLENSSGNATDLYVNDNRVFLSMASGYGSGGGLFYSDDQGASWNQCPVGYYLSVYNIEGNSDRIFISTSNNIYYSIDNGNNWISTGVYNVKYYLGVEGNEIFAGNYNSIIRSHDNGVSWNSIPVNNFINGTDLPIAFYDETDTTGYYFINKIEDHLIIRKVPNNIDTVSYQMNGISQNNTRFMLIKDSTILEATFDNGVYYSSDCGTTWNTRINELTGKNVKSFIEFNTLIYASTDKGLFYSSDLGESWIREPSLNSTNIISMAVHQESLFVGCDNSVYYQPGVNNPWIQKNEGLPISGINYLYSCNDTLYACTSEGMFILYGSNDEWYQMGGLIEDFSMIAKSEEKLFLSHEDMMVQSEDYGFTWTLDYMGNSVNYMAGHDDAIYAGMDNGLYVYDGSSDDWNSLFYTDMQIYYMLFTDSLLYATAHGGIYTLPLNHIFTNSKDVASGESLHVFPIPFTTFLNVKIPEDAGLRFKLTMTNSSGQLVYERDFSNVQDRLYIDGLDRLPAGIYFVNLATENRSITSKLVKL
ncbi:MAG TPA: T9SS type A sorting domain-containing protein [Lentimicrobium sp.]|nr:T9SS type A sorting domain-containing protein [Lentimicrobium sp.]